MKNVMITGATGVVGNALIKVLLENQIRTTVIVRPDSRRKERIPRSPLVQIEEADLSELCQLEKRFDGEEYDTFFHLGWTGTIGNARNDMQIQLKNVQYTLDAVELAASVGCRTFVGVGSQAEYGRVNGKLSKDTPVSPENGYGIAKLCAGQMSRILCQQKQMKHIWTRILSVYGPCDSESTMIMTTIRALLKQEVPMLTAGEQQWDYLYAMDAGVALYLVGKHGQAGKTYCIGSGQTKKLETYITLLRDSIDPNLRVGIGEIPYAQNQVMYLCADIAELTKDTGFIPQTSFEEGISETIDWMRKELSR